MNNTSKAIHLLEDKLLSLLEKYEFLRKENEALMKNNFDLQILLRNKEQDLVNQQKKYNLLKIAKTIEGNEENKRETKLKINALIREIDKCIVQLNQ